MRSRVRSLTAPVPREGALYVEAVPEALDVLVPPPSGPELEPSLCVWPPLGCVVPTAPPPEPPSPEVLVSDPPPSCDPVPASTRPSPLTAPPSGPSRLVLVELPSTPTGIGAPSRRGPPSPPLLELPPPEPPSLPPDGP